MAIPKFPELEEKILEKWEKESTFAQTMRKPSPKGNFVFFEGPPTANGKPGIHHLIARCFKDVILRYKTMSGYRVERKAGWDTHGLPVEIEVEKKLGFKSKRDIEEYGIAAYNRKCRESVWEYKTLWDKFTKRSGYWVDLNDPYITYDTNYIETLWWIVKKIDDSKRLYEGYKVVPHCPRCGTTLASHELAQGYDETEDTSVFVRFPIKSGELAGASFLVWTTTPWTLPANVALAVGDGIEYSEVEQNGERLVLATARLSALEGAYEVKRELKGKDLVGAEYSAPYAFVSYAEETAHKVYAADFVSTADGTGIVHTAPMYGVDDFNFGVEHKLPQKHLVNPAGEFVAEVAPWAGMFVKKADPLIIEDLKASGKLYKSEKIRHTYPFCWRCKTPLLYYAKPSWYFQASAVGEQMVKANDKVHWEPEHLKEGRFGEWLRGVKDWAITRERYWATPLPVWKCAAGHNTVIGSYEELEERRCHKPTRFLFVRHGEADNNVEGYLISENDGSKLTERGRAMAEKAASALIKEKPVAVYSSPIERAKETALAFASKAGMEIAYDDRLKEINFGVMNRRTSEEYRVIFNGVADRWTKAPEGGETWSDIRRRMVSFMREVSEKHPGETVIVFTHADPILVADIVVNRVPVSEQSERRFPDYVSVTELTLPNYPWNDDGELDPHRPYSDAVKIKCSECKEPAERVKDVLDVWFDSGSMPFAQWHYPFENKERIDKGVSFPAEYISEAIDQTRGWFYTLLAVSSLLGYKESPYKNVISMNHILDAKGFKMSKSKGNIVDPWEMFAKYGADAVRFYFFSVNQPGDYKKFDEKDVDAVVKKVFLILWNVMEFWKMSSAARKGKDDVSSLPPALSKAEGNHVGHVLDRWLESRVNELTKEMTENLSAYRPTDASRALAEFVNELSTWYVRRSRDRFKAGDSLEPLRDALLALAKLMAPLTPFFAEGLYAELAATGALADGEQAASVHLADWPSYNEKAIDRELLKSMQAIRKVVEVGHALRDEAGVKLRQPLAEVEIEKGELKEVPEELLAIAAEEMNVKRMHLVDRIEERGGWIVKSANGLSVGLHTEISEDLKREGWMREISRQINDLRKEAKLTPVDRIALALVTEDIELKSILTTEKEHLAVAARADEVSFEPIESALLRELELDGKKLQISIKK